MSSSIGVPSAVMPSGTRNRLGPDFRLSQSWRRSRENRSGTPSNVVSSTSLVIGSVISVDVLIR